MICSLKSRYRDLISDSFIRPRFWYALDLFSQQVFGLLRLVDRDSLSLSRRPFVDLHEFGEVDLGLANQFYLIYMDKLQGINALAPTLDIAFKLIRDQQVDQFLQGTRRYSLSQ